MASGGIHINLISREKLAEMTPEQRIRFIVDEIKAGKVLVLERGLTAKEELELIRLTMAEIDHESFIGVETPGFSIDLKKPTLFNRLIGRKPPPRMMVVGPAHMLRTIKKDGKMVQAMIVTKESMGQITMDQLPPPPDDWVPPPPKGKEEMPGEPEAGEQTDTLKTASTEPTESVDGEVDKGASEKPVEQDEGVQVGEPKEVEGGAQVEEPKEQGGETTQEEPNEEGATDTPETEQAADGMPKEPGEGEMQQGTKAKPKKYHSLTNYPEEPEEGAKKQEEEQKPEGGA